MGTLPHVSVEAGAITARTVGAFLLATWPRRLVAGLVLLLPAVVAALGGFATAEGRTFELQAGETLDLGPMTMRPIAFFVSDETNRTWLEATGGEAWLGVLVEVENTTERPISLTFGGAASDALVPQLPDGQIIDQLSTPPYASRVEDNTDGRDALPSLPSYVALLWPVTDPDEIGDVLTATMTESQWRYGIMSGEESWMSLGDVWTVELLRTEMPQTLVEPEDDL